MPETLRVIKCNSNLRDNNCDNPKMNSVLASDNIYNEIWKASVHSKCINPPEDIFKCVHVIDMINGGHIDIGASGTVEDHCKMLHNGLIKAHLRHIVGHDVYREMVILPNVSWYMKLDKAEHPFDEYEDYIPGRLNIDIMYAWLTLDHIFGMIQSSNCKIILLPKGNYFFIMAF